MGRTEPSIGRPPAGFRKDARAKKAKATINQLIPSLLPAHPRARRGIEAAELIVDAPVARSDDSASKSLDNASSESSKGPRIVLQVADTLTAARALKEKPPQTENHGTADVKVAVLNMASPLSPGGGFVNGANSQEESLCMRTTLLPSLRDNYYRLPEMGTIYTPDVLVFRDEHGDELLPKRERWHVDCITAAMLRGPETERDELGRGRYVHNKDRDLVLQKMRMVLRICQLKEIKRVVLGAWGCGAYGNPVGEIASAWHKVLLPKVDSKHKNKAKKEMWEGLDEVVFAIKDPGMAEAFGIAFGDGLVHEEATDVSDEEEEEETNHKELDTQELEVRIRQLEHRIEMSGNPQVKAGLALILTGLKAQLPDRESGNSSPS